jgi:hypothetical protein
MEWQGARGIIAECSATHIPEGHPVGTMSPNGDDMLREGKTKERAQQRCAPTPYAPLRLPLGDSGRLSADTCTS